MFWLGVIVKTNYKLNVFNNIASLDFKYKHNRHLMSNHCFIGKFSLLLSQWYKTKQERTTSSDQNRNNSMIKCLNKTLKWRQVYFNHFVISHCHHKGEMQKLIWYFHGFGWQIFLSMLAKLFLGFSLMN